jgi:two-component system, chemotaxis family, chemotaxis protein CheY
MSDRHEGHLRFELAGSAPAGGGRTSTSGPAVLVVDDDPDMTRLVGASLAATGCRTLAAYDSMQGFMVAQREQPALILVDLHMPAGGGFSLLERLRGSGRTRHIPVLVMTADHGCGLPDRARQLGALGFLLKPIDPAALQAEVTRFLA